MSFLNPFLLFGLAAVAVPLIIHLINLRKPKKVPFSTLSFFRKLQQSTIRRIRIKEYLLLALRIAAVLCLAIALARPFLPPIFSFEADLSEPVTTALLIDNSPSMGAIDKDGPYLDQAKAIARQIINGAGEKARFIIQTTNGEARSGTAVSQAQALDLVSELELSNRGNYTSNHLQLSYQALANSGTQRNSIYLISDGQRTQLEGLQQLGAELEDQFASIPLQFVRVGNPAQRNVAVSNASLKSQLLSKGNPITVGVTVTNFSESDVDNQFVSLKVEEDLVGEYEFELAASAGETFLFEVVPQQVGSIRAEVVLEGDDIGFDNTYRFVVNIPESRSVLLVSEQGQGRETLLSYIRPALEAANQTNAQLSFEQIGIESLTKSSWQSHQAIILDGITSIPEYLLTDLQAYVQEGRGLLFFPSEKGNVQNYNAFLEMFNAGSFAGIRGTYGSFDPIAKVDELVEGHPILGEMFAKKDDDRIRIAMPELFFNYQFDPSGNAGVLTILKSTVGDPLLVEQRFGEGTVLISAIGSDPGWSNFPINPLFAPLYFRSVLYASSSEEGGFLEHTLGRPFRMSTARLGREVELVKQETRIRPEVTATPRGYEIAYRGKEWQPGWLYLENDSNRVTVAVNQEVAESNLEPIESEQLAELSNGSLAISNVIDARELSGAELEEKLTEAGFGKEIWHWFIWLALLFLIAESVVSRFYKAESIS